MAPLPRLCPQGFLYIATIGGWHDGPAWEDCRRRTWLPMRLYLHLRSTAKKPRRGHGSYAMPSSPCPPEMGYAWGEAFRLGSHVYELTSRSSDHQRESTPCANHLLESH